MFSLCSLYEFKHISDLKQRTNASFLFLRWNTNFKCSLEKSLWNPFNQMTRGRWNLCWRLSQAAGIIFISSTACASVDLRTTSECIPFIPEWMNLISFSQKWTKQWWTEPVSFSVGGSGLKIRWDDDLIFFFSYFPQNFPSSLLFLCFGP